MQAHVSRSIHHALTLCFACIALCPLSLLQAQSASVDSLRNGLASGDWNARHEALYRINTRFKYNPPDELTAPIIALLDREADASVQTAGEGFGEYLIDLVLAATSTRDKRAITGIIRLDAIGVGGNVTSFVARGGPSLFPQLDSLAGTRVDRHVDVADVYGRMLGRRLAPLTRSDSAHILGFILLTAASAESSNRVESIDLAQHVPLPELTPILREYARSDPTSVQGMFIVRRGASEALQKIEPEWNRLSPERLVSRLQLTLEGLCADASPVLRASCPQLKDHLGKAGASVRGNRRSSAASSLDAFRENVRTSAGKGTLNRELSIFLGENARAVQARLAQQL